MQIVKENRNVQKFGVREEGNFTIAATAQAFKILSDGLYSNKIRAIVRELCCNAHDAHVAAGNKDPFEVHLPTIIEPWFAVRDHGIGLSHDDIMHLYTTYFESTKTNTNDETGCFGLGSKSPFSYTDQFTVTSVFDGMKRLYSAFIGETGNPQITLMNEEKSIESNGIEVKVTVKSEAFSRFSNEAQDVLSRFNPVPIILGDDDFKIKTIEHQVTGTGWSMCASTHTGPVAIQGNVAYPIDRDAMDGLTQDENLVLQLPMDIEFKLGELMITPSRESLSYGDKDPTTASIKRRCAIILAELPHSYQKVFDMCQTLWEAKIKFRQLSHVAPYAIRQLIRNNDRFKIEWKGQELNSSTIEINAEPFCDTKTNMPLIQVVEFERSSRRWRSGKVRARKIDLVYNDKWHFEPHEKTIIFYDDVGRGAHSRVIYFMENERPEQRDSIYVIKTDCQTVLKKFVKELGNPEIRLVSDLPKQPRAAAPAGAARTGVKVHKYLGGDYYNNRDCWAPSEKDLKVGGIYVPINRYKAIYNDYPMERNVLNSILSGAKTLGLFDHNTTPLYGVYPRYAKKLADKSNWISLWDYLATQLKDYILQENLGDAMAAEKVWSSFNDLPELISLSGIIERVELDQFKSSTSQFAAFVTTYREVDAIRENNKVETVRKLANRLNIQLDKAISNVDLSVEWKKVIDTYPMIALLNDYYFSRHYDYNNHIVDYINLVDAA